MHDPYAAEQVRDAYAAGLGVSAYHFTKFTDHNSAVAEANYFADHADQLGLPASTLMFADVEDPLNEYSASPTTCGPSSTSWAPVATGITVFTPVYGSTVHTMLAQ